MAKQPFYHRSDLHFTAEEEFDRLKIEDALIKALAKIKGYVRGTGEIETLDFPTRTNNSIIHNLTILFTGTREFTKTETQAAMATALGGMAGVKSSSVKLKNFDEPQPGDPSDL